MSENHSLSEAFFLSKRLIWKHAKGVPLEDEVDLAYLKEHPTGDLSAAMMACCIVYCCLNVQVKL